MESRGEARELREGTSQGIKLQEAILSNGEMDIGDVNIADMDPEDIRVSSVMTSRAYHVTVLAN